MSLIRNPRGIHFAGDTAQSISKDSFFRFANCGALFYTRFFDSVSGKQALLKPTLLPLSRNFRSHKGILYLASLVMELLYKGLSLFGYCGSKVNLILQDSRAWWINCLLRWENFLDQNQLSMVIIQVSLSISGAKREIVGSDLMVLLQEKDSFIKHDAEAKEFGEPRAILVRDEQTRRKLQKEVKDFALVLTILQSKGMEFEDVFIYDFFTTSPYGSDFAILEEILDESHSIGIQTTNNPYTISS